ncbi:beta strand repeat-containing protein [Altericista sp. CCNU0014]|uniref:beta strand repeat-containing protein n=1 Tax=Altericista sp. CCNU0014 TaxID=3082949 RepID=UPI00384DF0FB
MKRQRFRIFEGMAKGIVFLVRLLLAIATKPFSRKISSRIRSRRPGRVPPVKLPRRRTLRFISTALLAVIFTVQFSGINPWWTNPAQAQTASLYIEPLTWDFIGLDSNNPNVGPNSYLTGARVCNIGASDAINTVVKFVKEGATNPYITVTALGEARTDTLVIPRLTPGTQPSDHHQLSHTPSNCFDAYYNVVVQRTASAYNTVQRYYIAATSSNAASVRTPTNRQLYVEKVLSQGRNEVISFSGPSSVYVGEEYTFTLVTKTATAYPQLTVSSNFPNAVFQFTDISTQYSTPGVTNSSIYADACGWIADYTTPGYHESSSNCDGPVGDQYTGGKVGDTVTTTYKIKILSTGTGASSSTLQVNHLILDFSGGSYHYNSDYGSGLGGITISVIDRKADLSIDKSHVGNFSAGDNIYTLFVTNNGPDAAKAPITVTDTLPAGFSYAGLDSGTSANWTCSATGQTVSCTNPNDLANAATSTLKLKVNVSASAATNTVNTAAVSSSTTDPTPTNNTDSDPATLIIGPNISFSKDSVPSNATFLAGGTATYQLTASNSSGFNAAGPLTITDTLPAGLGFRSASGTNWSCSANGQNVTCTNPNGLNTGSTSTVTLVVDVLSTVAASVTNTATVSSGSLDTNTADNTATKTNTATLPAPDLTIAKTDNGAAFATNSNGTYNITVTNSNASGIQSTSGAITVTDTLPAEFTYISATSASGSTGWSCSNSGSTVTCTNPGPIAPGQSSSILLTVKAPASTTGSPFTNTVSVSTPGEATTNNNSASDTTPVIAPGNIDLTVIKKLSKVGSAAPSPACTTATSIDTCTASMSSGNAIEYTVDVINNSSGNGDDSAIYFSDTVPAAITVSSWTCDYLDKNDVPGGNTGNPSPEKYWGSGNDVNACNPNNTSGTPKYRASGSGNNISLNTIGLRKGGGKVRFTIVGTLNSSFNGFLSNTAFANPSSASGADKAPVDNSYTVNSVIPVDLSLAKTNVGSFVVGVNGIYRLTVKNETSGTAARSTAGSITVTDTLPAGLTFVSANSATGSSGWTCGYNSSTRVVTCVSTTALASQATSAIDITVTPTATGSITNSATVAYFGDSVSGNNTGSVTNTIAAPDPDLRIVKTAGTLTLGATGTYSIAASNIGTTVAVAPIAIRDTLPTGLTFVSGTGTGWSCSATGQDVLCRNFSDIAAGSAAPPLTLTVLVGSQTAANISNTATVDTVPNESTAKLANNTSTVSSSVAQSADLGIEKTLIGSLVKGQNATYQLKVTNYGPANVTGAVTVTDALPAGLSFVSGSGGGFSCNGSPVTCTKNDGLALGGTATIDLTVAASASAPSSIENTATVSSSLTDPNSGNNSSTISNTATTAIAALALNKSHAGNFSLNGQGTYTLEVANTGNTTIVDAIRIEDALPSQLSLTSFIGDGWTCTGTTSVTCTTNNDLAPGAKTAVDITVNVGASTPTGSPPTGGVTNAASAFIGTSATAAATDTDPTTITSSADLSVTKIAAGDFIVGQTATYQLTVKNSAASPISPSLPITLVDQLPVGLTYVSGTGTDWTCPASSTSSDITCTYNAALSPGNSSSPLTLTVTVTSQAGSSFTNFATVYSATPDSDTSNNTTSVVTTTGTISSTPNLLLVKRITAIQGNSQNPNDNTALNTFVNYGTNADEDNNAKWPANYLLGATNGGQVRPEDRVDYTIYYLSAGTGPAKNATICDRIPAHQTFVPDAFNSLTAAPNTAPASPPGDRGIVVSQGGTAYAYTNVADGDAAQYYAPGSTLPSACTQPALAEDNGAIVVNLGEIPNATASGSPAESYGFIRFRAQVK